MDTIKYKCEKGAFAPKRAHKADAGIDLRTPYDFYINGKGTATIDTGVHIVIPFGWVGFVKSKSGLMVNAKLVTDGVVDAGYTGTIAVELFNRKDQPYSFKSGDKIAQLVIVPCMLGELEEIDELEETERGNGGFGSTGK